MHQGEIQIGTKKDTSSCDNERSKEFSMDSGE